MMLTHVMPVYTDCLTDEKTKLFVSLIHKKQKLEVANVANLYFYILLQLCYGTLLKPPSTDKTSRTYLLQPP